MAAIAILAVVVVVWKTNRHNDEATPVAATPAASAPVASNAVAAPAMATDYLRLQAGENVVLNGAAQQVKPASSGFASLNLAPGNYRIDVHNGNKVLSQSITIDKPGTWLINPGTP